jgi:hypothetical protein
MDFCQTPIQGQTWLLTLFSRSNNNHKKKKNDPHPNSPRRGGARGLKFCMRPSVTKRIRLHPLTNSDSSPQLFKINPSVEPNITWCGVNPIKHSFFFFFISSLGDMRENCSPSLHENPNLIYVHLLLIFIIKSKVC